MRGPYELAALAVLLVIGAGSLAAPAGAEPRYSRLSVNASYFNDWDYGSNPESVFNEFFIYDVYYRLVAVVAHERRSLSIPGRNARVAGGVYILDTITVRQPGSAPDFEPRHELRECSDPKRPPTASDNIGSAWDIRTGGESATFKRSRNAGLSVNDSGLFIDPGGRSDFWDPGCHGTSVTEPPGHHGLQHAPRIELPAPNRSRFNGKKPFSYACRDSFEHEMATASDGSPAAQSHSFLGRTTFNARFRPFPPEKLERVKERLKKIEGKRPSFSQGEPDKPCP